MNVEAGTEEEPDDEDWFGNNFVNLLREKKLCGGGGGCLRIDLPGRSRVTADDDGDDDELDDATEIDEDDADGPGAALGIMRDSDERELAAMFSSSECRRKFRRKTLKVSTSGYVIENQVIHRYVIHSLLC